LSVVCAPSSSGYDQTATVLSSSVARKPRTSVGGPSTFSTSARDATFHGTPSTASPIFASIHAVDTYGTNDFAVL
jgi:hypothetical protein